MKQMSKEEIIKRARELAALRKKATPGPWEAKIPGRSVWAKYDKTIGWPKVYTPPHPVYNPRTFKLEIKRCVRLEASLFKRQIANGVICKSYLDDFDYQANLRLIAAAPEMAELLEKMANLLESVAA